ncbi:hypothetical protein MFUL124B02_19885 [Myxococcus fulvus 124B02]|nr:hypothetical protein MFUL124B02_19885 [Myxococcus fulvus 124B02]
MRAGGMTSTTTTWRPGKSSFVAEHLGDISKVEAGFLQTWMFVAIARRPYIDLSALRRASQDVVPRIAVRALNPRSDRGAAALEHDDPALS